MPTATLVTPTGFDTETATIIADHITHCSGVISPATVLKHVLEVGSGIVPLTRSHVMIAFTSAPSPVVKTYTIGEHLSPNTGNLMQFTGTAEIIEDGPYRWAQHDETSIIFACPGQAGLDGIFFLTEDPKLIGDVRTLVAGIKATKRHYSIGD